MSQEWKRNTEELGETLKRNPGTVDNTSGDPGTWGEAQSTVRAREGNSNIRRAMDRNTGAL